ncbi:hypothetical protein [Nonomuraea sp. NPDC049141]|uniref:hypothetical protein n=1 Tax=Nonomuraea sp. NPDC049141 TaxID=3155500 RepID=UPI0033DF357C
MLASVEDQQQALPGQRIDQALDRIGFRARHEPGLAQAERAQARHRFRTRAEARLKIATWIADFYNASRRHSANDGRPPITFERQMIEKRQASSALLRAAVA